MTFTSPTAEVPTSDQRSGTDVSEIGGMKDLWRKTRGDQRVWIALLDGGVNLSHPAFDGAIIQSTGKDSESDAAAEHGTHIASVLVGQHGGPVTGIAPQCSVVSIPIFKTNQQGSIVPCSQPDLAQAIQNAERFAEQQNAAALVINISGGQFAQYGEAHPALADAVANCNKEKTLIVAAAGNQGCDCLHVPGALPSVLAVGAMTRDGEPLGFSNWGKKYVDQGVLAVGEDIVGAMPAGGTTVNSGTSYATPIVSGIAALLLSHQLKQGKTSSVPAIRNSILSSALGCEHQEVSNCRKLLAGRLSVSGALQTLDSGDSTPMNEQPPNNVDTSISPLGNPNSVPQALSEDCVEHEECQNSTSKPELMPSSCGCGGSVSKTSIFAIGRLSYDFESYALRRSIEERMIPDIGVANAPAALMRHLFGIKPDGTGEPRLNVREASRVSWVLEYGGVPQYVLEPPPEFFSGDLSEIAYDYLEQLGLADGEHNLLLSPKDKLVDKVDRPDHFAVPGFLTGETVRLTDSGRTVPIVAPQYDLTDTWNLDATIKDAIANGILNEKDDARISDFRRTASALYSHIDPKGASPESRAMNFIATASVLFAAETEFLSGQVALRGFSPPSRIESRREEEMVYEVVAHYFDVKNVNNATYHRSYRVNVSEPKPFLEDVSDLGFGSPQFV